MIGLWLSKAYVSPSNIDSGFEFAVFIIKFVVSNWLPSFEINSKFTW